MGDDVSDCSFCSKYLHVSGVLLHLLLQTRATKVSNDVLQETEVDETQVEVEVEENVFDQLCLLEDGIFLLDK